MNPLVEMKSAAALRAAARVWRAGLRPARLLFAAAVGVVAALSMPLVAASTPSAAHTSHLTVSQSFAPRRVEPQAVGSKAATDVLPRVAQPSVAEGATNPQGERLLAGADRYATAVLLAEVPLDAGDAATREVLVVSGESLVDAVSAVSVAASRDAAIVLTATDTVPEVVAEFIARRGFDRVTVGGGTAAVSDTTAEELAALVRDANDDGGSSGAAGGRSSNAVAGAGDVSDGDGSSGTTSGGAGGATGGGSVPRVAGATRFETAVAAARAADQPGNWCDTGYRGAIVVSGESLVDGVIAAPVAYAWRLPLLFTEADRLPEVVDEFLKGVANVRHVTVVGAPDDISDAVVRDIARANDVNVLRIDAATPAARSVELATAMEDCAAQPVAPGEYALMDAAQPVDGVAAAAALATGLGSHSQSNDLIPILAVNQNTLPAEIADYLRRTGETHNQITLYPLGGVARLTPRVITSAMNAAQGNPDTGDAAGVAAGVDVSDAALIAAGLTPGKSDGTGVAVGVGVVVEDGVIRLEPTQPRRASTFNVLIHERDARFKAADAMPIPNGWFASPGVLDPYLWQPEIRVLEAGVDHDGDGTLSPDERWPLGSPERAAYMVASGGQAPPGATVLVAPDVRARNGDEGERNTAVRYPAGIPVPPGAPDRTQTTFEQRQLERKSRFEAYSGGRGFGVWATDDDHGFGPWRSGHYQDICAATPNPVRGQSAIGVTSTADGITCETAADWYLWMCDTMNTPEINSLGFVEAWLTTIDRFQDQWISQVPAEHVFQEGIEDSAVVAVWALEQGTTPLCTYNADPANYNSEANLAAKAAALRELNEWGSDPANGFTAGSGTPDADSAFWDWPGDRMFALRDVSESRRNREQNEACWSDVRECSTGSTGGVWGLRSLA